MAKYEDLHDEDESDEEEKKKTKEYPYDPGFSETTIVNYKKKHGI